MTKLARDITAPGIHLQEAVVNIRMYISIHGNILNCDSTTQSVQTHKSRLQNSCTEKHFLNFHCLPIFSDFLLTFRNRMHQIKSQQSLNIMLMVHVELGKKQNLDPTLLPCCLQQTGTEV